MYVRILVLAAVALFFTNIGQANAQDTQTLFNGNVSHGGFGAPVVKFSDVGGDLGVWVGGRGGWIISVDGMHSVSLGFGGYGLTTSHPIPNPGAIDLTDGDHYGMAGYGGFEIEYTNRSSRLVHVTASSLIGAGGVMVRDRDFRGVDDDPNPFFVVEPGVQAEVNVTSFLRVAGGLSYRLTSGVDRAGFSDGDFSGINGLLTIKFGRFL